MELTTIAKPYAKAIYQIASSDNSFESWQHSLDILGAIATDSDSQNLISSPSVNDAKKIDFINKAFASINGNDANEKEKNLISLLVANNKILASQSIANLFGDFVSEVGKSGKKITVFSAYELSADEKDKLSADLKQKFATEITLETMVDTSLVGGVVIKDGDKVIDLSISASVEKLAACLN